MSRFTNKKSCNLFFLLVAMMFSLHGKGQDFILASQTTQQAYGYSRIRLIITDSQGNIYSTGSFGGTVNFDPSLNNYLVSTPASTDFTNSFILKWDKDKIFYG